MNKSILFAVIPFLSGVAKAQERPNIILIMTDQHRFDYIGATNADIITPNLNALCHDGYRFTNGYTASPSSTPARAGLLTGLSPWHHGLLGYATAISEHYKYEMPRMLADAGYYTAAVGKMHWTPQRNHYGLHDLFVDESGRVESPGFVSDYRQWFHQAAPQLTPDSLGVWWNSNIGGLYPLADSLHPTHWTAQKALDIIDHRDKSKPLFLKVSFARPHAPYDPPKRFYDLYAHKSLTPPWLGDWCDPYKIKPSSIEAPFADFGPNYAEDLRRYYAASVTFVDEQIGRVVQKLKEDGLYDNSIIIFVSDHGDMLGDHYHWRKTYPYEGSAHVPLIVKLPKSIKAHVSIGKSVSAVAELRDILPTFLETAGVDIPKDMDGKSLYTPIVKGKRAAWRPYIDMEHAACYNSNAWVALTDGRIKYVWNYTSGLEELYDLANDPHELHNQTAEVAYAKTLQLWRKYMVKHLTERGETWVKDAKLQIRPSQLKSPHFNQTCIK